MANEVILSNPIPQLLFADHVGNFGAAPATPANTLIIGTPTDIQIDCGAVAAGGGSRQSAKSASLGSRPPQYTVDACIEFAVAPTDGDIVQFFWAASANSTAGTGNPAGATGSDAAFTETDGNLSQMQYIGRLVCRANVLNIGYVGSFIPRFEYGILVITNRADQAVATVVDEFHVTATPVTYGTA